MKLNKPYSDNVIFLDTEFTGNEPGNEELLSIGLVKISGEELYIELKHEKDPSDWVKENVLPSLKGTKLSKAKAVDQIKEFIGDDRPYPVTFINVFDMVYLYDLFGSIKETPFHWPPIDFASILFANGIDHESYYKSDENNFFHEIGIDADKYNEHNALDDARLLREVCLKLVK